MDWLQAHAQSISALASSGMFLIWGIYAWLFYQEFRRQRGSLLFIHEAGGSELESACVVVNLSKEPIHLLCTMAASGSDNIRLRDSSEEESVGPLMRAKQGPLQSGESLLLGSFEAIYRELHREERGDQDEIEIEIRIAAIHGFREWPVGARRRFRLEQKYSRIIPMTEKTEQFRSKRQAREVRRWLNDCRK